MKKILIVNIGTEIGGIEKCLINFLKYLAAKDCTVDLALWKPNGPLYEQIPAFVNVIDSPGPGSFSSIKKEKNILRKIKKLIRYVKFKVYGKLFGKPWKSLPRQKKEYDIAISYCQNGYSPYYVIDNVNADKKFLWYHELNYNFTGKKKAIDENYFEKYTNIITVSNACKNNLSSEFVSLKNKFITLYNFYDYNEILEKANQEENPFKGINKSIVVTVGRLSEEKGYKLALEACYLLKEKTNNFIWYWIGDGGERQLAENILSQYGLNNYFVFLGNQTNPYPYIKNCDIYVQPSLSEAFCTTIIEAEILCKKMVVSNIPSVYEQIKEDENHIISEKNPIDFSCSIFRMLNSKYYDSSNSLQINNSKAYDIIFFGRKL